jgi:hypothetical protein
MKVTLTVRVKMAAFQHNNTSKKNEQENIMGLFYFVKSANVVSNFCKGKFNSLDLEQVDKYNTKKSFRALVFVFEVL